MLLATTWRSALISDTKAPLLTFKEFTFLLGVF